VKRGDEGAHQSLAIGHRHELAVQLGIEYYALGSFPFDVSAE